jgi:ABC-type glycerol-3-phosphate transport system substrate-binding protein
MSKTIKSMKLVMFFLFIVLFALLMAGCGGSDTTGETDAAADAAVEAETDAETSTDTEAETVAESEPVAAEKPAGDIVVWGWEAALNDTIEAAGVIEAFNAEFPDVNVEFLIMAPNDVYTNLPLAITAGDELPDVVLVENSRLAQFVHMGGGTALTDLTDKVGPYVDQFNAYKWTDCTMDGKYYCLPWDSGPVVMYYRRDVFDAAGLPSDPEEVTAAIATWDDYLEACQQIKEETGAFCFAHNQANNFGRLYEMTLWEQGLGYYDLESGEVTVDSPENIATLETLGEFWDAELVSDNLEWTDPWYAELGTVPLEEQPIATIIEASWMEVFMKDWIAPGTAGLWGVAEMPSVTAGGVRASNDGGSTFVIPAEAPNPEAAWAFIEHALAKPESQLAMFETSGFIPSLETTYDDALFEAGDEFFDGQNARAIYADVVQRIPSAGIYGPNYNMMNGAVSLAIQRYAAGEVSAAEALQEAAAEIRANLE